MTKHWPVFLTAALVAVWATNSFAQRERDPQGEAVKNMIFGAFGTLLQQGQCEMIREQQIKAGRQPDPCIPAQGGYYTQQPAPPPLPPLPTPDKRNDWGR